MIESWKFLAFACSKIMAWSPPLPTAPYYAVPHPPPYPGHAPSLVPPPTAMPIPALPPSPHLRPPPPSPSLRPPASGRAALPPSHHLQPPPPSPSLPPPPSGGTVTATEWNQQPQPPWLQQPVGQGQYAPGHAQRTLPSPPQPPWPQPRESQPHQPQQRCPQCQQLFSPRPSLPPPPSGAVERVSAYPPPFRGQRQRLQSPPCTPCAHAMTAETARCSNGEVGTAGGPTLGTPTAHTTPSTERGDGCCVFVGNLAQGVTAPVLLELLSLAGPASVRIPPPTSSGEGEHRGYGFGEFRSPESARYAIGLLNGLSVGGRALRVSVSNNHRP